MLFAPNYDFYKGTLYISSFTLEYVGEHVAVWITWDELTTYTGRHDFITKSMLEYIGKQFDEIIYPAEEEYFGTPQNRSPSGWTLANLYPRKAVQSFLNMKLDEKIHIFVTNIRDEQFYERGYPYYIAGFFWPGLNEFLGMNIIFVDSYDWQNRLGPNVTRAFLYETVVAHEYAHMIHYDADPDEDTWVDEGIAMLAEYLTYGVKYGVHPWAHIDSFLFTPDNSLIQWGDQGPLNILADYGAVYLHFLYLCDLYGPSLTSAIVSEPLNGREGVNKVLTELGFPEFDDVFHHWTIANLFGVLDLPYEHGYTLINLSGHLLKVNNVTEAPVEWTNGSNFGPTKTILGHDTSISLLPMYGTDYINFSGDWTESFTFHFNGDDYSKVGWKVTCDDVTEMLEPENHAWYSTTGNLIDYSVYVPIDLTPYSPETNITLTFRTYYDIEPLWDFGFVQVSTDGGLTWISLNGTRTTYDHDPNAHPDIVAQLPGFTGSSEGWYTEQMNLSPYAGHEVIIRFRYMTDWAVAYPGWWIDDIKVTADGTEIFFSDVKDVVMASLKFVDVKNVYKVTWSDGFYQYWPEVDFKVTLIAIGPDGEVEEINVMSLDDLTEEGSIEFGVSTGGCVLILVSPTPPLNTKPVDYMFKVEVG